MKTFKEYLTESTKTYSFKIKVAGELPEGFEDNLKTQLGRCGIASFEKRGTTPIQESPLDFPTLKNCEVHMFEVVCEYPITSPEIAADIKQLGLDEACFRVRGSGEPTEVEQVLQDELLSDEPLLTDSEYKEAGPTKIKHKDYFGADFNKSFLKDLEKTSKQQKKDGKGPSEYKLPKAKSDKTGSLSPLAKVNNPNPVKG